MKPVKTFAGSIEGELDSEQDIPMGLDQTPEGIAHILSLMTDMYSDFEMACLREYSTNARDSMIEVGKAHLPIKVTTPTALSPHLVIVDEGAGLSIDDLTKTFAKYGASTKRGSDLVNGMLGIGGKAALTYTSQFMVTAVKDGIKAQIVVTRNEDGVGVMKVVDTRATTEPNGVEIKIPAKGHNDFLDKANRLFYFWQPGSVLLNGKQPKHLLGEKGHTKIGDNIFIVKDGGYSYSKEPDIIVMGNVAYPLSGDNPRPFSQAASQAHDIHAVVFMDMGEITFAPSREAIAYNSRSSAAIARYVGIIKKGIADQIAADLKGADSYGSAFSYWQKWGDVVGFAALPDMEYNGEKFITDVPAKYAYMRMAGGRWQYQNGTGRNINGKVTPRTLPMSAVFSKKNLFVVNYPNENPPAGGMKDRLETFHTADTEVVFLFPGEMPGSPWTDEIETVDWDDVKAVKLSTTITSTGGKKGAISVVVYESDIGEFFSNWNTSDARCYGKWETKSLDSNHPIVYVSPVDISGDQGYTTRNQIGQIERWDKKIQIVRLGANRHDKFRKDNPTAVSLQHFFSKVLPKTIEASLTDDEKVWAGYDADYHSAARTLKGLTNDPDLKILEGIIARKVDTNRSGMYNAPSTKNWRLAYPLCGWVSRVAGTEKDHTVLYINAVIKEGN